MTKILIFFRNHIVFILLLITGFLVFHNVLDNRFVWLDITYILNNPQSHRFNIPNLFTSSSLTAVGHYRPLAAVYLTAIQVIFGSNSFFYHIFQILLYIISSYFVYIIFRNFFKEKLSLFLSLIFLLHPMNEGIIGFISSSADVLYLFFGLLALVITIKSTGRIWEIISINMFLLLSLLSKESGILFVFAVFIFFILYKKRNTLVNCFSLLFPLILYLSLRYFFQGFYSGEIYGLPFGKLTFFQRLINIPSIFLFYISKFFIPFGITGIFLWTLHSATITNFYFPLLIDLLFSILILSLGFYIKKKDYENLQAYYFFSLIFWVGVIVYMQFIALDYTVSARWFNFAMIGLLGLIGLFIQTIHFKNKKDIFIIFSLSFISLLTVRTIHRNDYWQDDISLFTQYTINNDNYVTESLLANAYFDQQNFAEAMIHIKKSVTMLPYDNNLAIEASLYDQLGNNQQASIYYDKSFSAKTIGPWRHDTITSQILGRHFLLVHENKKAEIVLNRAILDFPSEGGLWVLETINEYQLGNFQKTNIALQKAYLYYPDKNFIIALNNIIINKDPIHPADFL